jgi:hypothetical protein
MTVIKIELWYNPHRRTARTRGLALYRRSESEALDVELIRRVDRRIDARTYRRRPHSVCTYGRP